MHKMQFLPVHSSVDVDVEDCGWRIDGCVAVASTPCTLHALKGGVQASRGALEGLRRARGTAEILRAAEEKAAFFGGLTPLEKEASASGAKQTRLADRSRKTGMTAPVISA